MLLVRAEESDEAAVAWACRLVQNRDIQVTCLPVIPAQTGLQQHGKPTQTPYSMDPVEGSRIRINLNRSMRQLDQVGVIHELSLQEGEPHTQIKRALTAAEYDLVIVAAEPYDRSQRFILGELVSPLLQCLDRPMLIAKPTAAEKS